MGTHNSVCTYCGDGVALPTRLGCQACEEFIGLGETGETMIDLMVQFFRRGALIAAQQTGLKGKFVRAIAMEAEQQRLRLWKF